MANDEMKRVNFYFNNDDISKLDRIAFFQSQQKGKRVPRSRILSSLVENEYNKFIEKNPQYAQIS